MRRAIIVAALLVMAAAGCGCAARSAGPRPDWIDGRPPMDENFIYGYGTAQAEIENISFKTMTAFERARVDLAKNIYAYSVGEMLMDDDAARYLVEKLLPSREDAGSWRDGDGNLHARVRINKDLIRAAR